MCNDIRSYGSNLNNNEFEQFVVRFADFKKSLSFTSNIEMSRKRKIEKQVYFPNKKSK